MSISIETKIRIQQADARIVLLEGLLSKWVAYCDLAGVDTCVSGDYRDSPFLAVLKDSKDALAPKDSP